MKFSLEMPLIKIEEALTKSGELEKYMGQEALATRTRLISEFQKGKDANGNSLRPYSRSYNRQKWADKNKTPLDKNTPDPAPLTPDLTVTGELARSIDVKTPKSLTEPAEVFFRGTHKGGFANAALARTLYERGFVGWFQFGKPDLERIGESFSKLIDKVIAKLIDVKK